MKKTFAILSVLLFSFSLLPAQEAHSLFWKISGNGLKKPSYIFGTHHAAPLSVLNKYPQLQKTVNRCKIFCGEVVIPNNKAQREELMTDFLMPSDTTLRMLLSEEEFHYVDSCLIASFGLYAPEMAKYKPFFITQLLMHVRYTREVYNGSQQRESIDQRLQRWAKKKKIKIIGLDTPKLINSVVSSDLTLSQQAKTMVINIRNMDHSIATAKRQLNDYMEGDLENIQKDLEHQSAEFKRRALDDRNVSWIQQLLPLIRQKSVFVAVGTGHLCRDSGLLHQLRQNGYTVEPIMPHSPAGRDTNHATKNKLTPITQ